MLTRIIQKSVFVLAMVFPVLALADGLNVKTGAWEMTTTVKMTGMPMPAEALAGMPEEQRAQMEKMMQARAAAPDTHVTKSCVTQEDLDRDQMMDTDEDQHCQRKVISKTPSKMVFEQVCGQPSPSTSTATIETTDRESVVMSVDMQQEGAKGKVHVDIKGRWLGSSCAGTDDDS